LWAGLLLARERPYAGLPPVRGPRVRARKRGRQVGW
jgi:hypothetical protein